MGRFYKIYLSDHPEDPMVCRAESFDEAAEKGVRYIDRFSLDASIIRIEKGYNPEQ